MPKRVDRAERRADIVDAYLRIVARGGVDAATTRALAAEADIATGALWHYFAGFDDVVRAAFQRVFEQSDARIDASTRGRSALDALDAMVAEIRPHDTPTHDEAVVAVSFWGLLPSHSDFRDLARSVEEAWRTRLLSHLREAVAAGQLVADTPVETLADALLCVLDALQVREVAAAEGARGRGVAIIEHLLSPWRSAGLP